MRRPAAAERSEFVVQANGQVRQAGATTAEDAFIRAAKARAEHSLFYFAKAVLGYTFLSDALHKPICDWLQRCPPVRKLLLMPRDHGKSTLGPRALPLHLWVQPADANPYFPGQPGTHTRILLAGETELMAQKNLRVIRAHAETNDLLRAFWPHVFFHNPRKESRGWNDSALIVRRDVEFAEPSLQAIGVGGAITGAHPNVLLKDDITTEAAANSDVVMQTAIDWHINTRALLSNPATDLELTSATYWAVADLPHLIERDPSVATNQRFRAIADGAGTCIWPEKFTATDVAQLMREFGPRFYLLYMNSVSDAALVDFPKAELRTCTMTASTVSFLEDDRDVALQQTRALPGPTPTPYDEPDLRGRRFTDDDVQAHLARRPYHIRTT